MHSSDDFRQLTAASQLDADGAVAREPAGAGEDEIAHARQAGESLAAGAAGDGQTTNLRQTTGNKGGDGVVSQSETVAYAGGDGDNILQRTAQLDANNVVAGVNAEARVAEFALHQSRKFRWLRGCGDSGRIAARNFNRERRPTDGRDAMGLSSFAQHGGDDFAHAQQRAFLDALGGGNDDGI